MHTEPHDSHKKIPPAVDAEHPGYEREDINVRGIITFIVGLSAFVLIFFFFCFIMGKAINYAIIKRTAPTISGMPTSTRWARPRTAKSAKISRRTPPWSSASCRP